ncbi:MAG: hypothetical protein Q4P25_04985 [Tissierellia bacterium]|nr:hypothetical protein [Tissierellia bacterium]
MANFWQLMKKDLQFIWNYKFIVLLIIPIIMYSAYINLIYSKHDIEPVEVHLSTKEPKENAVFIENIGEQLKISFISSKSAINDELLKRFALTKLEKSQNGSYEVIGKFSRPEKLQREMVCEVLFFEMVAIILIGSASILFKEKNMGALKLYRVLPISFLPFIFSKLLIFTTINFLLSIFLIILNIGIEHLISIISKAYIDIFIISTITLLLSHIFAIIFKDFKQFGIFYAFMMIFMTTPVFLAANTPIDWNWIEYYPVYKRYISLKTSFFENSFHSWKDILISLFIIFILLFLTNHLAKNYKEI